MHRTLDFTNEPARFNPWVARSIRLFAETDYLDQILEVYPFAVSPPRRLAEPLRRAITTAHINQDTSGLISLLRGLGRFPYEDPAWHSLRTARDAAERNPQQLARLAANLYQMTPAELFARLEAAPAANTQLGPMFGAWLLQRYPRRIAVDFEQSTAGIVLFDGSEEAGKTFVRDVLRQDLDKRPDLLAKVNQTYVLGEAKWIGNSGGNQEKQVKEVLHFCAEARGNVRRVGIIDGFPWALYNASGGTINNKETVKVQETPYPVFSALVLPDYLTSLLGSS